MSSIFNEDLTTKTKVIDGIGYFKELPELPYTTETCGYKEPVPSTDPKQILLDEQMQKYVGRPVRLQLIDGRFYQGIFYCYDCDGNIVLNGSGRVNPVDGSVKHSGVAIVSHASIVKIQVKLG